MLRSLDMSQGRTESYERIIREAIAQKRVILIRYKDVARTIQPHILGYDRHEHLGLSAWQIAGTGAGWRLFYMEQISDLSPTDSFFLRQAPGYNPCDPSFARVVKRL